MADINYCTQVTLMRTTLLRYYNVEYQFLKRVNSLNLYEIHDPALAGPWRSRQGNVYYSAVKQFT